jgi:MFS transporter, PPP family, 3-phenylpropionic acid transporter
VRFLVVALIGFALSMTLLSIPRSFAALAPLVALLALFRSPIGALSDSLIVRMASRHRLDYGRMRLWGSFGFAVVALLCGVVWERIGFGALFVATGLLFFPVIFVAAMLEEGPAIDTTARPSFRSLHHDRALLALLVATFLIGASTGMSDTFSGIYVNHLGGSEFLVGAIFAVAAFSELPTMRYGAAIARHLNGWRTLLLAYALLALAYAGYAFAATPSVLLVLALLRGMGFGLFFVSTVRIIDERVPEAWSATVQGLANASAWGLGPLLAGPLSGAIYDGFGPAAVFVACAVSVALAALVLIGSRRWTTEGVPGNEQVGLEASDQRSAL